MLQHNALHVTRHHIHTMLHPAPTMVGVRSRIVYTSFLALTSNTNSKYNVNNGNRNNATVHNTRHVATVRVGDCTTANYGTTHPHRHIMYAAHWQNGGTFKI
ncbi:unnamed protein product [Spodoptera littoralis]|uniref:Uncharacterized protein n=1 Tax=Spodoptera littoralis TaxID=7109 RepID=A0A9P0I955_SPOLI|nr:unnamed protein product [Spodoptera littoralis]CAH1641680.1 unnamed protein product [Spodoptera littoralis]